MTSKAPARKKRARETPEALRKRAASVIRILRKEFPAARTALAHRNPFQLLVATILSAQCTDERVNKVTKELFAKFPSVTELAAVSQA